MANTTVNIDIEVQSKSLAVLEEELAQINAELKKVPIGSDAFKELTKDAQKVTGELEKVNNEIKGFTFDEKIRSADGAVKLLGGSLAATVGVLGTLGVESEAFGEFEKKAASAIAVAVGFKDISEGIQQLGPFLKQAGSAVKGFSLTTKQALIATGVGAFVVLIGTLIAYWDEVTAAVEKFGEKVPFVGKAIQAIKDGFNALIEAARPVLEFLGIMPTQMEAAAEATRKAAEASIGPLQQELALLKARKATADQIFAAEKKLLQSRIDGAKDEEERLKAQNELAVAVAANETRIAEEREAKRKEAAEKAKARREEEKANAQEAFNFLADLQQQELDLKAKTDEQKLQLEYERTLKEIDALKVSEEEKNKIKLQAEINYGIQVQDLKDAQAEENKLKEQERVTALNELLQQFRLDGIEDVFEQAREELRIQEEKALAELTLLGATEDQKLAISKQFSDKRKDLDKEEADFKKAVQEEALMATLDVASSAFGAISQLVGENSKVGKAAAIAQTVIDTYQSATAAYKSVVGIPIVGPALAPVAAGVAIAAGIANLKKIKSTQVPGGGGASGPNIVASTPAGPNVQNIQPQQQQIPQTIQTAPTVQAYVLSGNVTSAQEADAKLARKRTVGG